LDKRYFQPSPFDKLRAGSAGLEPEPAVLLQYSRMVPIIRLHIYSLTVQINCISGIMEFMGNQTRIAQVGPASTLAVELHAILGKLKRRLREHGGRSDLTPSQVSVLLRLEKDGAATVSSLARAEGMRPQSMSAIIAPLQEAGLVSGSADPNDGRQTLMSLTRKCQKWLQEYRAARQDWLASALQEKLSAQEQERLAAALKLLSRLVED
jgi:DNA-binding MarR family transcriptional regulator